MKKQQDMNDTIEKMEPYLSHTVIFGRAQKIRELKQIPVFLGEWEIRKTQIHLWQFIIRKWQNKNDTIGKMEPYLGLFLFLFVTLKIRKMKKSLFFGGEWKIRKMQLHLCQFHMRKQQKVNDTIEKMEPYLSPILIFWVVYKIRKMNEIPFCGGEWEIRKMQFHLCQFHMRKWQYVNDAIKKMERYLRLIMIFW